MKRTRYRTEVLDAEDDNGTMPDNVDELRAAVVGHRIVKVNQGIRKVRDHFSKYAGEPDSSLTLTLDNGTEVLLIDTQDCCACTELAAFLLHPEMVDHVIMGVGTTDGYETWHIYADYGDILTLTVGWTCGNPFYYGYGFDIKVLPVEVTA